jgi:hypothetical protein
VDITAAAVCVYLSHLADCAARKTYRRTAIPSLISVLVTEIQQRRVCGAGSVLSAQGLGLTGPCDEHWTTRGGYQNLNKP